jgi:hypothetical protein
VRSGWGATGGEWVACRMTNPFRRRVTVSLRKEGEAWTERSGRTRRVAVRRPGARRGWGLDALKAERSKRRGLSGVRALGRSQNPRTTAAVTNRGKCGKQSRT